MAETKRGWLSAFLDLFFPPRCAGCGWRGIWLCPSCIAALPRLVPPLCRHCGRPTRGVSTCPDCWRRRPAVDGVQSPFFFEDTLRVLIHRFKYRRARHLTAPLVQLLLNSPHRSLPAVELIVPVPLHPNRLRRRGYNQATLLAEELGRALSLPVVDDCVQRVKDTPAQTGLAAAERRRNVRGAFACQDNRLAGRRVLLVDDVCTTGATLDACATAMKRGGASFVAGLTLARAR